MLQQTIIRFSRAEKMQFAKPMVITNNDFRFIVREQAKAIDIELNQILIESEIKNTAPAILAACLAKMEDDPNAILLVTPTDHVISNTVAFHEAVERGLDAVDAQQIVTFGVVPDRAETGYGYLEVLDATNKNLQQLISFREKPSHDDALKMLEAGNFFWNAGMFMFRAKDMLAAFEQHCSDLIEPVAQALEQSAKDFDFVRLAPEYWARCKSISIDYAIMEKINNILAVQLDAGWSDLGDWQSVWREQKSDEEGNVITGTVTTIDCQDSLLQSSNGDVALVGIGLTDIIAVAMKDAVLVAHKGRTQEVKNAVSSLTISDVSQAENFPIVWRPWGWVEVIYMTQSLHIKRVHVQPRKSISLQSHEYRAEHWVVIEGTASVSVNDEMFEINEYGSIAIPAGAIHQLENKTDKPLVIIELQTGRDVTQSDITRYPNKSLEI